MAAAFLLLHQDEESESADDLRRANWRMPPLRELPPMRMTPLTRIWMVVLRGHLVVAGGLVLVRIISWQPQSTAETRCRHRSRQMAKTSHDIQSGIWTTVGSEKQLSARRA